MLILLKPSGFGHRRLLVVGISLASVATFGPKKGFATEAALVVQTSGVTARNSELDKEKANVKDKDPAKVEVKDAEVPVKAEPTVEAKDSAKIDVKDAGPTVKADAASQPAEVVKQEKGKGEDDIDFTSTAPVDPIPALGEGVDDFQDLDKRAAQYAKEGAVESEDARVERELKVYKEAEAKAEREKAQQESAAREAARADAREEAEKSAKTNKKTESEADAKARELQGIDKDDLGWKGLED